MSALLLHRGDTWTLDLSVQGLPPLAGGAPGPFDLSNCIAQLAVATGPDAAPVLAESFAIPASSQAQAGLARLVVPAAHTQTVPPGNYKLHLRIVAPGAVPFAATQAYTPLKVLPSLLPAPA